MNATDNTTLECDPALSAAPRWVFVVYGYFLIVFGTLGNTLALWCVATCTKTRRPVKILLFSVFLPDLVTCLTTVPLIAETQRAILTCFPVSKTVHDTTRIVCVIMIQIEVTSIAATAVVRTAAVWAPHRAKLGMKGAVVLVVVTCIQAILSTVGVAALVGPGQVSYAQTDTTAVILNFAVTTLPSLITASAYLLIIFVIHRNKRRLEASQQQGPTITTMDQVTRAILAVFISNLVFILPVTIYRLTGRQPEYIRVLFEVILVTHFMVDPLLYIRLNSDNREKVLSLMRKVLQPMSSGCISPPILQTGPTASCDQQEQQIPSTHSQEESKL